MNFLIWLPSSVSGVDPLGAAHPRVLKTLEPDVPCSVSKDLAMECFPFAHFEQYTLRRASRLVRWVMPIPNTCLVRM